MKNLLYAFRYTTVIRNVTSRGRKRKLLRILFFILGKISTCTVVFVRSFNDDERSQAFGQSAVVAETTRYCKGSKV